MPKNDTCECEKHTSILKLTRSRTCSGIGPDDDSARLGDVWILDLTENKLVCKFACCEKDK